MPIIQYSDMGFWKTLLSLGGAVSPIGALREQISLLKAQLAEAHSLIANQKERIEQLEAKNEDLAKQAEQLKSFQSEAFTKPINKPPRGIV